MSESNQKNSGNEDYDLSVKQAAKALGKSTRTIHRYIDKGKLSRTYVTTENGKEIRLKSGEIIRLAARLNDTDGTPPEGDNGEEGPGPFGTEHPTQLNIREVLARYERTLYQLGETSEKLKEAKERKKEKVTELQEERDRNTTIQKSDPGPTTLSPAAEYCNVLQCLLHSGGRDSTYYLTLKNNEDYDHGNNRYRSTGKYQAPLGQVSAMK